MLMAVVLEQSAITSTTPMETIKEGIAVAPKVPASEYISRIELRDVFRHLHQLQETPRLWLQAASIDYDAHYEAIVPQSSKPTKIARNVGSLSNDVKITKERMAFQDHVSAKGIVVQSWKAAEPPVLVSDVEPINVDGGIIPKVDFPTAMATTTIAAMSVLAKNEKSTVKSVVVIVIVVIFIALAVSLCSRIILRSWKVAGWPQQDTKAEHEVRYDPAISTSDLQAAIEVHSAAQGEAKEIVVDNINGVPV